MPEPSRSEVIRQGIEAFGHGDANAILAFLTEDVEWKRVDGLPDAGGTLYGRDAVRALLEPEAFADARLEVLDLVERGDTVLVRGRFHARGFGSGIELNTETAVVYRFRGDLVSRVENWQRLEDAERSAGFGLRELSPRRQVGGMHSSIVAGNAGGEVELIVATALPLTTTSPCDWSGSPRALS